MARHGDGLYLRGKSWYLDCRINGTRYVENLGKGISRTVAKELASIKRAAILKGEAGIRRKKADMSFEKAAEEFLICATADSKPRTLKSYQQCLHHLQKSFAGKRLSQICSLDVERHKRKRIEEGARVRPNREIAVLRRLFNRCKAWGVFEGENPTAPVEFLKEPKQRLRYLEIDEEIRLLEVAQEPLRSLIILGVNTGLRIRSEALSLRWIDVDFRRNLLTVQAAYAKNGHSRAIILNSRALEALETLKASRMGEFVFCKPNGIPYKEMGKPFAKACQKAGLAGTGVTLHTLRHTFASRLAMADVDIRTIQELGGWSTLSMVQRYAHLSPRHKRQEIERIAEKFHNVFHNTVSPLPLLPLKKDA
jgi:integrase